MIRQAAIKNKTEEDFKKVSLHDIAKKYNQQAELKEETESSKEEVLKKKILKMMILKVTLKKIKKNIIEKMMIIN